MLGIRVCGTGSFEVSQIGLTAMVYNLVPKPKDNTLDRSDHPSGPERHTILTDRVFDAKMQRQYRREGIEVQKIYAVMKLEFN